MSASVSALAVSAALLSSTPAPATVPAESQPDPAVAAERAAIVAKGKRFNYVSAGFTVASLSLTLTSIFIARPGNEMQVVAMAGTAAGLAGVGLGFAIAGMRRTRHPEKFMKTVAAAPAFGPNFAGANVRVRF